jgi:hypothetical protein
VIEEDFAQMDPAGKRHMISVSITEHIIVSHDNVQPTSLETTTGRDLIVKWVDGTTSCIPLKDMDNPGTIEAAEYAVAKKLA